jgi:hypothetical protein
MYQISTMKNKNDMVHKIGSILLHTSMYEATQVPILITLHKNGNSFQQVSSRQYKTNSVVSFDVLHFTNPMLEGCVDTVFLCGHNN